MYHRLRSYLGYPPVRDALPNTTHYALAALQHAGIIPRLITQVSYFFVEFEFRYDTYGLRQNVDGLHHKALVAKAHAYWPPARLESSILELHGTLHVGCTGSVMIERGYSL